MNIPCWLSKIGRLQVVTLVIAFLFMFFTDNVSAQEKDFGIWTDLKAKLNKSFALEMSLENRMKENASERDKSCAEIALEYGKNWYSFGTAYRFANETHPKRDIDYGHRFSLQFSAEATVKRFTLSMRNKFQSEYFNLSSSESGKIPRTHYRNRVKIEYNVKGIPIEPFCYYEFYYRLNSHSQNSIEKSKFSSGLSYKINKKNKLGISYIYYYSPFRDKANRNILSVTYGLKI
jgi:hypothetical protein